MMKVLRTIEILAWTAGVSMLVAYGASRSWFAYGREQSVASFAAIQRVDMSAWSRERIAQYRASMRAGGAPQALLRIPSLNLVVPVFEGTSEENLNRGAGRIEGTAHIGDFGNIGIAAHRDGFFRVLKDIRVGSVLQLDRLDGTDTYRIVATKIVDPSDVSVLAATSANAITLVTCYPFYFVGSAPQRFIVRAEKTPAGRTPAGDGSRVALGEAQTSDDGDTQTKVPRDPD
jgi:LPXTG-site transpeptidase (sortase) family protein